MASVKLCLVLLAVFGCVFTACSGFKAFMRYVDELTHCPLPNELRGSENCHKCIADCIVYFKNPKTGTTDGGPNPNLWGTPIVAIDVSEYPTCDVCRTACALQKPDDCAHVNGYQTGIACADWGGVGYCI